MMNYLKLSEFIEEINRCETMIRMYQAEQICKDELHKVIKLIGVYEQRNNEKYMIRIRLPAGIITVTQLLKIAELADKYTFLPLHLTTRQNIQIHHLDLMDTVKIMRGLLKINLSCRGGGGDTVRNITASDDGGTNPNYPFDVSPYAYALSDRMIIEADSWHLPRKFKIAFSGNENANALAIVSDLGFIAKINENGNRGFSVYIAGGMGAQSRIGFELFKFAQEQEVYNIAKAVKQLFDKYGNRLNRNRARLRFLYENQGKETFLELFNQEFKDVKSKNYQPLMIKNSMTDYNGSFQIPFVSGKITVNQIKKIYSVLKDYGEDTLRLLPAQNLLVRNIPAGEMTEIKNKLFDNDLLSQEIGFISEAVSCTGADICKLGKCQSACLLNAINKEFKKQGLIVYKKITDIKLKISGCANCCGHHLLADIGFSGFFRLNNEKAYPAYHFFMGACFSNGKTEFAQKIAVLPAKNIPQFLIILLKYIEEIRIPSETIYDFIQRTGTEHIKDLADQFSTIPLFEENSDFYQDWENNEVNFVDDSPAQSQAVTKCVIK